MLRIHRNPIVLGQAPLPCSFPSSPPAPAFQYRTIPTTSTNSNNGNRSRPGGCTGSGMLQSGPPNQRLSRPPTTPAQQTPTKTRLKFAPKTITRPRPASPQHTKASGIAAPRQQQGIRPFRSSPTNHRSHPPPPPEPVVHPTAHETSGSSNSPAQSPRRLPPFPKAVAPSARSNIP